MKTPLRLLIVALFASQTAVAQIKLIGSTFNNQTNQVELLQWLAFDQQSVINIPTTLDAYLFASSAFDPYSGNYLIGGISDNNTGIFSYNTDSGVSNLTTDLITTNVAEFDMSTGKMYNLIMETEEYINVYSYDFATNTDSLIGTIYEPGVNGIIVDAIGFDSDNGIIYYVGFTNDSNLALYAIPVRESEFSFTKTILNTTNTFNTITSLNFDNVNDKLFATNSLYDENGLFDGLSIVQIDINNGDITTLTTLDEFQYFVGGSSLFDQNSATYMLVGITTENELLMIAFDTNTNTYTTGFVPDNVSEIECDNTLFAQNRYASFTAEKNNADNIRVFPNPVQDNLNLRWATNTPVLVQIVSTLGELVYSKNHTLGQSASIDMSALSAGMYTVQITDAQQTISRKIIVE